MSSFSLTARWVFPVAAPPLPRGVVSLAGETIVAVEPHGARTADVDLGNVALIPGLVNAHTHLDLSGMRGVCPPSPDFVGWLRGVIAHRRAASPEQTQADVRAGIAECLRYGTTLVGDIAAGGASWDVLTTSPLRSIVFYELIGLSRERAAEAEAAARVWLAEHRATTRCRPGVSPHAPYSVRRELFGGAAHLAYQFRVPLAVHIAESLAEIELLHNRRGPFVAFLKDLGVWDSDALADGVKAVMDVCNLRAKNRLFVHGNHLAPSARIPRHSTVVYCPRTHAAFGHPEHPFRAFLDRGVRVALGTDGLSSNPDLDLLAEARFIHRQYPDFPADALLRMATLAGAEALGWSESTGSLEPGKSADLVAVPLADEESSDPYPLLFRETPGPRRVLSAGVWVERNS